MKLKTVPHLLSSHFVTAEADHARRPHAQVSDLRIRNKNIAS